MSKAAARLVCLWLTGCVAVLVVLSWRWPLVGDASYMHYVVFLMHRGMTPYRDIVEMNLPGAYLIEDAVMSTLGQDSAGWRIYDLLLLSVGSWSMLSILKPWGRVAGIFAAALFVLLHAQDGVIMSGQRDFAVAVLLLAAAALVVRASERDGARSRLYWLAIVSAGATVGLALTVKPTVLLTGVFLFAWLWRELRRNGSPVAAAMLSLVAGVALPVLGAGVFLAWHHSLPAFVEALHGIIPYHASLGHQSFSFLLNHSVSPLLPLVVVWVASLAVLRRAGRTSEGRYGLLVLCCMGGFVSYLLQAKGFSYQRYPFTAFLLVVMAADLCQLARLKGGVRFLGWAGLAMGTVMATVFLLKASRYDRHEPPRPLLVDLRSLGAGQREVQCMDTAGSCVSDFYAARLVESTGFLYDCYLLDGKNTTALGLRRRFWQQMDRNPPRFIVVTDSNCFDPHPSFDRFSGWPEFQSYLGEKYGLVRESGELKPVHYWSRAVTPFGYRIYKRR